MIFPTDSKDKIGKDFSWPLGAEAISAALSNVLQANLIGLQFMSPDQISLRYHLPPLVFEATYYFRGPTVFSPQGSLSTSWQINIRAVQRMQRHRVKTLLLENGLPNLIKPWLQENYRPDVREGDARVRLWFDPIEDCLIARQYGKFSPARV